MHHPTDPSSLPVARPLPRARGAALITVLAGALAACGGGSAPTDGGTPGGGGGTGGGGPDAMSAPQAVRLSHQAGFGVTESDLTRMQTVSPAAWVADQMTLDRSRYGAGGNGDIDRNTSETGFCERTQPGNPNCWRDFYSTEPLLWDFYRNALTQPDVLRQRVAFALQQILVVSNVEVDGTYGHRGYQNMLLTQAFGNYRDLLRGVTLSPVMGEYLDHVNNDRAAPNENFARELLQLFSIGTCALAIDGTVSGGRCQPTYSNDTVRAYAYALTGWTYPTGGANYWGCWPEGANCRFMEGEMTAVPALHDAKARTLLSGVRLAGGHTPQQALDGVLDSLMTHPNIAPFISRQLIQHLVTANPPAAYVERVARAFNAGRFSVDDGGTPREFGTGRRGDLAATVAAVLLDRQARDDTPQADAGRLRDPALMMATVLRTMNGTTDGNPLGWWWGGDLRQHVFRAPSVFNFYPPDFPLPGTTLAGPTFAIHGASSAFARLNYLVYLFDWNGSDPDTSIPGSAATRVDTRAFEDSADKPAELIDRLSMLAFGGTLEAPVRAKVLAAVRWYDASNSPDDWRSRRVARAAYLVFASPQFQVTR